MRISDFWGLIHKIKWGDKIKTEKDLKKFLSVELKTQEKIKNIRELFDILHEILVNKMKDCGFKETEDLRDQVSHIIGSGIEDYKFALNNPEIALSEDYIKDFSKGLKGK